MNKQKKSASHETSGLDAHWKAVADFIKPLLAAKDRLIVPPELANCFPDHQSHSYQDDFSGKYQWIILHGGMPREAEAGRMAAACLVLEPVFANEVSVVFATRNRLKALSPEDSHYRNFLASLEDEISRKNPKKSASSKTAPETSLMEYATEEKIKSVIQAMLAPVVAGKPNLNPLAKLVRSMPSMVFDIKTFGYDLALRMAPGLQAVAAPDKPQRIVLKSKATTSRDIKSEWQAYWFKKLGIKPVYIRKVWELCFASQAVWQSVDFEKSPSGIGFGCGEDPLASLFASMGADIMVTDLAPEKAAGKGWLETAQHTHTIEKAFKSHIIDEDTFRKKVTLRFVDMNDIPKDLHGKFDFCWSICALEHLGSIKNGLDFIENSLKVLKPGGVAVHTTEYNFTDEKDIIDNCGTVLFHRQHFEEIHQRLTDRGYNVCPLDFELCNSPVDRFIDLPPYFKDTPNAVHLKFTVHGVPSTGFGMIVKVP